MSSDLVRRRPYPRAGGQSLLLSSLFVLSMAFDFKGAEGGSPIQYAMITVNTAAFVLLALRYRLRLPRSGFASVAFWGWTGFLITGSAGALINDVPFGRYIRTVYPFALFALGFLVAWWVVRDERSGAKLIRAMTVASIASFLFTILWGFYFSGRSAESIRYQILSPLIPFLLVTAGYDLIFVSRHRLRSLVILVMTLSASVLSVTRGMLLVIGAVVVVIIVAWLWNVLRGSTSLPRPIVRGFFWGAIAGVASLGASLVLAPNVVLRWLDRFLGQASGITLLTRVAAIVGQWEQIAAQPTAWFFGQGFGHTYRYAESFASLVIPVVSPERFSLAMWYPGEFMWMTPLYYGGFLSGALAIIVLLWGGVYAFRILTILLRACSWRKPAARPIWLGVLGYFAFLGTSFTANPFIFRLSGLFMGLTLGLTIAAGTTLLQGRGE